MCSRGMVVHCSSRLGAAVAVQAAEIARGEGVFAKPALERAKAVHHSDGVMSHSFNCRPLSRYDSKPKTTVRRVWHYDPVNECNNARLAPSRMQRLNSQEHHDGAGIGAFATELKL